MTARADLYALLAELLAEPPEWMSLPGREWPLVETLTQLAAESEAARRHLDLVAALRSEEAHLRRERYASLFQTARPRYWLYESAAKTGKIFGPETFELANLYHTAGLDISGAELPDHISLELAFLSYLASQAESLPLERQFLAKHGAWMIDLGRALQTSGDEVYAVIGALLADWLTEAQAPVFADRPLSTVHRPLPAIPNPDECTLCGFCAQVCPTHALKVMQNAQENYLALTVAACKGCGKCESICDFHALKMSLPMLNADETLILRRSPHALCEKCGKPIASQAEMDYIARQVGDAPWQHLCLDCRAYAVR
jgi:nitrate reductase assembly molybdenum cofactor insertion protein NarJ/Pyruvate/2-oxoacid:ferredoxin oxidoreductase delta subunit